MLLTPPHQLRSHTRMERIPEEARLISAACDGDVKTQKLRRGQFHEEAFESTWMGLNVMVGRERDGWSLVVCNARWLRCWVGCWTWAAGDGLLEMVVDSGCASQREMHPRQLANRHMASRDHGCGHGCAVDDKDTPGVFGRSLGYRIALAAPRLVVY